MVLFLSVSLPFIFYFVWFVFLVCLYYVYLYMGQVSELKLMMMMMIRTYVAYDGQCQKRWSYSRLRWPWCSQGSTTGLRLLTAFETVPAQAGD